jgi:methylmalonyl-CoA mutase N-terminal domain/subunit
MGPEASGGRTTPSGIPLKPFYTPLGAAAGQAPAERPGEFPFTRGIHAAMYRERLWTMRQYSGFGDPRSTNERFRYLLSQGQTGLSVAFDLPTQVGYDSDSPLARGEVGKVGVPISTVEDMEELFQEIPLESVSVSMTINAPAAILLAFLIVAARRRGLDPAGLRGTVQNDILKEFVARRTHRFPLAPSMRLAVDVLDHCARRMPRWNPISVSGYHIRESGTTADQELAYTFAHAIAYLELARSRGLGAGEIAARFSFFFNAQMHLFEEVAKFRAARRIWAHLVRDRFGVRDVEAQKLRFHAQTAGSALTWLEPENNAVRVTIQALAAVLGGVQSLHTNALDEALGLPTEATARLALRTQQVIGLESGAADVADPLGGCPLVEELTGELEARALRRIEEIDRLGGAVAAIESGRIQREIEEAAYRFQREIDSGARVVVGVNRYRAGGDALGPGAAPRPDAAGSSSAGFSPGGAGGRSGFRPDPALEEARVAALKARKGRRDSGKVSALLGRLKAAAAGSENLMDPLIAGAEGGATLGEMMSGLAEVFGEAPGGA